MRRGAVHRATGETNLQVAVEIDGVQAGLRGTLGIPFFEHMLNLLAKHAGWGIEIGGQGDLDVDFHHTVEDTGLALGQALRQALGDKNGIERYGEAHVPMEETLARCVLDLCNRPYFRLDGTPVPKTKVGAFDAELGEEFLRALAMSGGITMHLSILTPAGNVHHMLEALFKATGLALGRAAAPGARVRGVLSTKGTIS